MATKMKRPDRLRAVEIAIRDHGWSPTTLANLQASTGAAARTLYRDKEEVLKYLQDEMLGSREKRRTEFLLKLRQREAAASADGKHSACATMLSAEAKVLGLAVPPPDPDTGEVDTDLPTDPEQRIIALLGETRKAQKEALARGSYGPYLGLLEKDAVFMQQLIDLQRDKAEREKASVPTGDLVSQLADVLSKLPETLRNDIIARATPPEPLIVDVPVVDVDTES